MPELEIGARIAQVIRRVNFRPLRLPARPFAGASIFGQNACCESAAPDRQAEPAEEEDDANCPKETLQRMSRLFQSRRDSLRANRRQRVLAILLLTALANLGLWFFGEQPAVAGGSAFIVLIAAPGLLLVALILERGGDAGLLTGLE